MLWLVSLLYRSTPCVKHNTFPNYGMCSERCLEKVKVLWSPEKHLFEHAVGCGHSWKAVGGKRMQLQIRGD